MPLDREEVRTALWMDRGNITKAAIRLKVPSERLRRFVNQSEYLLREAREADQQLVDIAKDNVYEALTDEADPGRRDTMARFVMQQLGGEHGWGNGKGGVSLNLPNKGRIVIGWDDGSTFDGNDNSKTIEHSEAAE